MILKKLALLLTACTVIFSLSGQIDQKLQQIQTDVVYLSSDYLEGREAGTTGEQRAAAYLASRFEEMGLQPAGVNGWFQKFPFRERQNPHSTQQVNTEEQEGMNVVGMLDLGAPLTVVIGAHFDHLGYGGSGSLNTGEEGVHNGADDNASGTAGILRLANVLKENSRGTFNYLFIGFSAEEKGLFGSKYFAQNSTIPAGTINCMINMDMIGRLSNDKGLLIMGTGTSPTWPEILEAVGNPAFKTTTSESGVGPTDHTSFYLEDIPVLNFFTGQHSEYHKPSDDAGLINFEGILAVTDYILDILLELEKYGEKLVFTKTKDEQDRQAASFKVSLGVMPDYTHTGEGMRIDGVISGRAAEKAGMQKGDVLIKIGETKIKDIYDYMEGLSKFQEGDSTTVVILRDGKEIEKSVRF